MHSLKHSCKYPRLGRTKDVSASADGGLAAQGTTVLEEHYLLSLGKGRVKGRCIRGILAAELSTTSTSCWGMWSGACVSNVQTVQLEERFLSRCYYIARKIEVISLFPCLFIWSLISFLISGKQDSCSQDVHKCVCACLLVHLFKPSISSLSFEHTISFQ